MAELRAGGLAIFVAGPSETIGLVVITERFVSSGEMVVLPSGRRFRNSGSSRWLVHSDRIVVTLSDGSNLNDYALVFQHWLMPIDGDDFSNEDEHQKEREHA
ncbi:hypothetical protein [Klebsiella oxytoca]|uniref:hypothetical protein n=1 Tax=Klebsiella oxytoca TaxID=571 RepID=UPI001DF01F01|nr:hypothetical protein [Klebsiella oxytoca]CAF2854695.1 hypothetical protein AI2945V1_1620 [Klebsiella oxytoca]CAF2865811.1 hypothetical protein AI2946V1_1619 [Klebsiella oxytoca]CAH5526247.1 hypothetical protein AI2946V1_1619 [Klebsiella oxytoca]CAH5600940.1 hypothetical protein AI2945V1_1620 [Klebsiella oxytoca]